MRRIIAVLGLVAVGAFGTAAVSQAQGAGNNVVRVTKQVVGTPPPGTTFHVVVECYDKNDSQSDPDLGGTPVVSNLFFDASGSPSPQEVVSEQHDFCRISEPGTGGASSVSIVPPTTNFSEGESDSCGTENNHTCDVTVTNTFGPGPTPPPPPPPLEPDGNGGAGQGAAGAARAVVGQARFTG
jgi:hypothetical protein